MTKNIWELAEERLKQPAKKIGMQEGDDDEIDDRSNKDESHMFILGSKHCGKTSLILRFLEQDESPKPTIALEYSYCRRTTKANVKEVGHIWELGGGRRFTQLLKIPIKAKIADIMSVILVVDLSKPEQIWDTIESCLESAKEAVTIALKELDSDQRAAILKKSCQRVGQDHVDKALLQPFPVPLAIVGGNYDIFQGLDPDQKKTICKTLRFIAHMNGATLQFYSSKMEALIPRGRAVLSHLLFGTTASKGVSTDHNKPLTVPVGTDAFSEIGTPPLSDNALRSMSASSPVELWKTAFGAAFPQKNEKIEIEEDPSKDPQYKEESIDLLRTQKDQELERYIKQRTREANLQKDT